VPEYFGGGHVPGGDPTDHDHLHQALGQLRQSQTKAHGRRAVTLGATRLADEGVQECEDEWRWGTEAVQP